MKRIQTALLSTAIPAWAPESYIVAIESEMIASRNAAATMVFKNRTERSQCIKAQCYRADAARVGWSQCARKALRAGIRAELDNVLGEA